MDFNLDGLEDRKVGKDLISRGLFYQPHFKSKFTATSELKEKTKKGTVVYKAQNLAEYAYAPQDKYVVLEWNYDGKPWVEGVDGYGIGEKIKLSTAQKFQAIDILNGYVDPKRPDLYKKNSRVKTFAVKDLDNDLDYIFHLEDVVEFQTFNFRKFTKNIELTILEVYEGDKWADTCVTGITPRSWLTVGPDYEDTDVSFEQSYTYKCDRDEVLEDIKNLRKK